MQTIRIGSRKSRLAVIQSELVAGLLRTAHPDLQVELVTMDTAGDRDRTHPLDTVEGKGFFTQELETELRKGTIDLCVHSLKDTAPELPDDLPILAFSRREDPRDVLVLPYNGTTVLREQFCGNDRFFKGGAGSSAWTSGDVTVGCSSSRRCFQIGLLYPEAVTAGIRGNVPTRLAKLDRGEYGALLLAAAGLKRLGLEKRISRFFSVQEIIPAAGQGILAVQGRSDFDCTLLSSVDDPDSRLSALAERQVIRDLNGGCTLPSAAYCEVAGTEVRITALYCVPGCSRHAVRTLSGVRDDALKIAEKLALELRKEVNNV